MSELKKVFMQRDGMSSEEADKHIQDLREQVEDGFDPEELLYEEGLEPDYIFDIL